jgi:pimeloyl-ACP methyl ester carboxylesterase
MQPSDPFRRGPFEALPERPHRAHPYFQTRANTLELSSQPFGPIRIHLRVHGEGPPLLLIHGLMTSSYSWRYVLTDLGRRFTLYIPDLPGAGRSDKPLAPRYGPEAMAEWLGELQTALGIRGCAVVANSMGGYLAMRWALRDPAAMSCLVNVHSPGVVESRLYALQTALAFPGAKKLLSWLIRRNPLRWAHRNVHYYDESLKSLEEAREYGEPLATAEGARAFIKFLHETMAIGPIRDFQRTLRGRRARAQGFPVPLLLLYAESDPMVPPRFGKVFSALIPEARYVVLSEASHFAHVDAVPRFLAPVLEFLERHAAPVRAVSGA